MFFLFVINLDFEFSGVFDFTEQIPLFDFSVVVENAKLDKLNLYQGDSLPELSFAIKTNFVGLDLDNFIGDIYRNN